MCEVVDWVRFSIFTNFLIWFNRVHSARFYKGFKSVKIFRKLVSVTLLLCKILMCWHLEMGLEYNIIRKNSNEKSKCCGIHIFVMTLALVFILEHRYSNQLRNFQTNSHSEKKDVNTPKKVLSFSCTVKFLTCEYLDTVFIFCLRDMYHRYNNQFPNFHVEPLTEKKYVKTSKTELLIFFFFKCKVEILDWMGIFNALLQLSWNFKSWEPFF